MGFGVWGLGFRFQGKGLRIQGVRFRVDEYEGEGGDAVWRGAVVGWNSHPTIGYLHPTRLGAAPLARCQLDLCLEWGAPAGCPHGRPA